MEKQKKYKQGCHPNTLKNLAKATGRTTQYDTYKKTRTVTVTDEGWQGFDRLARESGFSSRSELLEQLGRGLIKLQISA